MPSSTLRTFWGGTRKKTLCRIKTFWYLWWCRGEGSHRGAEGGGRGEGEGEIGERKILGDKIDQTLAKSEWSFGKYILCAWSITPLKWRPSAVMSRWFSVHCTVWWENVSCHPTGWSNITTSAWGSLSRMQCFWNLQRAPERITQWNHWMSQRNRPCSRRSCEDGRWPRQRGPRGREPRSEVQFGRRSP